MELLDIEQTYIQCRKMRKKYHKWLTGFCNVLQTTECWGFLYELYDLEKNIQNTLHQTEPYFERTYEKYRYYVEGVNAEAGRADVNFKKGSFISSFYAFESEDGWKLDEQEIKCLCHEYIPNRFGAPVKNRLREIVKPTAYELFRDVNLLLDELEPNE